MPDHKIIGLIGYPLGHSFSNRYFTGKFSSEEISGYSHRNFELSDIKELPRLLEENPELIGLNVTIPYKVSVIPFLDSLDDTARTIGAVNTIRLHDGRLEGFNTDYYGFKESLKQWVGSGLMNISSALILGTGGASRAVDVALTDLGMQVKYVSRNHNPGHFTYEQLHQNPDLMKEYRLIVNCTPLGTYPDIHQKPSLPYEELTSSHFLYDLVYNPEQTSFLTAGIYQGAKIKNGLQMLHLQAEESWSIWTAAV
jgi:shikimate dehydrogenase